MHWRRSRKITHEMRNPNHQVCERLGHFDAAVVWAQAELASENENMNLNVPSRVRAGRCLGRVHAKLGQHGLSVAAIDAAIGLASSNKFLLDEALGVRARRKVAREAGGAGPSGLHWSDYTCEQRVAEVAGRMHGPAEPHQRLMRG